MRFVDCLQREKVVMQSSHGNIISGTQQTVDGPANMTEKRKKKNDMYDFPVHNCSQEYNVSPSVCC